MDDGPLEGARVHLVPLAEEHLAAVAALRRTAEVRRWWRGQDVEAELASDLADPSLHAYAVVLDGQVVGLVQFSEEDDPDYRSASVDVLVDPSVHRRGHGSDAVRTLCDHLFDARGHHRVTIDPAAGNAAAIACYAGVGFRPVGVLRSYERQTDGTWADGLLMDLLSADRR